MTELLNHLRAHYQSISADAIYIPLQLIEPRKETDDQRTDAKKTESIREIDRMRYQPRDSQNEILESRIDPFNAIKTHTHIWILGEPGEGKTTLIHHIANQHSSLPDGTVPIWIPLREYRLALSQNIHASLCDYGLAMIEDKFMREWMGKRIGSGNVVWLLDGLDETGEFVDRVGRSIAILPGRVILTSRPTIPDLRDLSAFKKYFLAPISPEDINRFTRDWFIQRQADIPVNEIEQHINQFEDQLNERPLIKSLTKNPLLLTILLTIFISKPAKKLPGNRFGIYQQYLDTFENENLLHWRDRDWTPLKNSSILDAAAKDILLEGLYFVGWTLHLHSFSGAKPDEPNEQTLLQALEAFLVQNTQVSELQKTNVARDVIDFWKKSGMLEEIGQTETQDNIKLAFRHLTFQEFAVSISITRSWAKNSKTTWHFLRPRLHHYAWREPILLASGQMETKQVDFFVKQVLSCHSLYERNLRRDLALAGEIINQNGKVSQSLKNQVIQKIARIVQTHYRAEIMVLSGFYLLGLLVAAIGIPLWFNLIGIVIWTVLWCLAFVGFPVTFFSQGIYRFPFEFRNSFLPAVQKTLMVPLLSIFPRTYPLSLITVLGKISKGNNAGIDALIDAAWRQDLSCSNTAVNALGEIGDNQATKHLIALLYDSYHGDAAIQALEKLDDPAIPIELMKKINNRFASIDYRLYPDVVRLLGKKKPDEKKVAPILIRYMLTDYDELRSACEEALKNICTINSLELLLQALLPEEWDDGEDYQRSECAGKVIANIGHKAIPSLLRQLEKQFPGPRESYEADWEYNDQRKRFEAVIKVLSSIQDEIMIEPLINTLDKLDGYENGQYVRAISRKLLSFKSEKLNSFLISLLDRIDPYYRPIIADEMQLAFLPSSFEYLVSIHAKDQSEHRLWGRWQHFRDVLEITKAGWVPLYINLSKSDHAELKEYALVVLGQVHDRQISPIFINNLNDPNPRIRKLSLYGLQEIGSSDYIPTYIETFLADSICEREALIAIAKTIIPNYKKSFQYILDPGRPNKPNEINTEAVNVLKDKSGFAFYNKIVKFVFDDNSYLSDAAFEILNLFGDKKILGTLEKIILKDMNGYTDRSIRAITILGDIKDAQAIPVLRKSLFDEIDWKRKAAAKSLGKTGDISAVPDLIKLFKNGPIYEADEAENAIRNIGLTKSVPALLNALTDSNPFVRSICSKLIGEAKSESASNRLTVSLKNDPEERVRLAAATALGLINPPEIFDSLVPLIQVEKDQDVKQAIINILGQRDDQKVEKLIFLKKMFYRDCHNASFINQTLNELLKKLKFRDYNPENGYVTPAYKYKVVVAIALLGSKKELGLFIQNVNHYEYHNQVFSGIFNLVQKEKSIKVWKQAGNALTSSIWFNQNAYESLKDIASLITEKESEDPIYLDPSLYKESKLKPFILPALIVIGLALLTPAYQALNTIVTKYFEIQFIGMPIVLVVIASAVLYLLIYALKKILDRFN